MEDRWYSTRKTNSFKPVLHRVENNMMHGKKIEKKNKTHQKIMKLPHDEIE